MPSTITLGTSKDNTLYQSTLGNTSDGAGPDFYAGRVGNMGGTAIRRGLIAFDIANNIPAGSTINSVVLTLQMDQSVVGDETVELHPLLADWGEGTSDSAVMGGGRGAPATTNDATWVYRFYNTTSTWSTPGGDFSSTVSASTSVAYFGSYTWGSTPQMVRDVQGWLDHPDGNFGWLVRGNEATGSTAKRFATKENSNPAYRPALTIDYTSTTAAASLQVSGFPSSVTAGTPGTLTVTALDASGHTATGYTGTVHFTSSDPQALAGSGLPADYTFTTADAGVHQFTGVTLRTAGPQSITATDTATGSITGTEDNLAVLPAAPDHILFANPSTFTAGLFSPVTVTVQDVYDNTVVNYTGTVHFTSSLGVSRDYTYTPADMGQRVFMIRLYRVMTVSITGTDTGGSGATGMTSFGVVAAPAVSFAVFANSPASSGSPFDVTVVAIDQYGNVDTNYAGTVHLSTTDADPGVLVPTDHTFQPGDAGVVTFPGGVTLITPGMQTVMVSDLTGTLTGSVDIVVT